MDPAIHTTLRRRQRRLVRENPGVLAALVKGANLAISECQHQFRNRRWNCSTKNFLRGKNLFGKIVDRGTYAFLSNVNFLNNFCYLFIFGLIVLVQKCSFCLKIQGVRFFSSKFCFPKKKTFFRQIFDFKSFLMSIIKSIWWSSLKQIISLSK